MDFSEIKNFDNYLKEISKYRKNYIDYIEEKYVNTYGPARIVDIYTLKVVEGEGEEATIPDFGTLNSYSCEATHQLVEEIEKLKNRDDKTSEKKFLECAEQSSREVSTVDNKDPDTSKLKISVCDLSVTRHVNEVSNKDLDISQKKFSECGKRATVIAVRKNPAFKRNLNFLPLYKNISAYDLALSSSSFSEISNSDKKVTSCSNSNSNTDNYEELDSVDKQRKDKYPVKTKQSSRVLSTVENKDSDTSKLKSPISAKQSSRVLSTVENKDSDTSKLKSPVTVRRSSRVLSTVEKKDPDTSKLKSPISVRRSSRVLSTVEKKDPDTSKLKSPISVRRSSRVLSTVEKKDPDTSKLKSPISAQQSFTELQITNVKIKDPDTSEKNFSECVRRSSRVLSTVEKKDPDTSKLKSPISAKRSSREVNAVENKDSDTSELKIPICDLSVTRHVNEVSNKDLDISQKKCSECGERTTVIAVRKNPTFKRNLNFLSLYKNISADDLALSSSSFSEISNSDKNVSSCSNSNSYVDNYEGLDSVDKQRKDKYPVKSKCNSKISCTNLTAKSIINYHKWQTYPDDGEEIVICNSKTSYAKKMNLESSILNCYTRNYKGLDFVNKQRNDECPAKFHCETSCIFRSAKSRHPYYRKPHVSKSSNNGKKLRNVKKLNKRRTYLENSKKIVENFFSTHTKNGSQNIVCNNNITKVPRVTVTKLEYCKYAQLAN